VRFLIVTQNLTLRDSLRMVISGLTDAEVITARDCAAARAALLEHPVDAALFDGHLRMDDLRALAQEISTLAPAAQWAVLLDGYTAGRRDDLAAAGAPILSIYTQPAGEFFDTLARFIRATTPSSQTDSGRADGPRSEYSHHRPAGRRR
jgi:DNA-binding NarL/FixJ family response regulator